jgi:predicted TPR repeat methyltransferase
MAAPVFSSSGDLLADRRYDYAMAVRAEGDFAAAADLLAQALEIAPHWAAGWFALGETEAARGKATAAADAFTRALDRDPADPYGARLALARLGIGDAGSAMTPAYVAALFDQYAPRFDATLRDKLAYRGPEVLLDAVGRACAARGRRFSFDRMIDLGCGTGLAAEVFASAAGVIDGVDLSGRMIDLARAKRLYRNLAVDDLASFLARETDGSADLVLAADVFVYLADIAPVIRDSARVLAAGGMLAFTVETHAGDGVVLGAGLRYAHGAAKVREALAETGLELVVLDRTSTRNEADQPVPGLVVAAIKV